MSAYYLSKYEKLQLLGTGSYGSAVLVRPKANKSKRFVIKEIWIKEKNQEEIESARQEAALLEQMSHRNVVSYIESFFGGEYDYILFHVFTIKFYI